MKADKAGGAGQNKEAAVVPRGTVGDGDTLSGALAVLWATTEGTCQ